jgi:hypothetical protein
MKSSSTPAAGGDDGRTRRRLTYNRKTILRLLAEHPYLTTKQFYGLLKDHIRFRGTYESYERNIRAILRNATKAGYVKRDYLAPVPPADDPLRLEYRPDRPFCYRLTGKGKAIVGIPGRRNVEKSPASLAHEAEITAYHIALESFITDDALFWKQSDIKRTMNPDALFAIKKDGHGYWFFLEVEKSRQGNQRGGKSGLERKCERYDKYRGSAECRKDYHYFSDFRLVIVFANAERQTNFLAKTSMSLPYRWIWTTSAADYRKDAGGRIYRTPQDFTTTAYSLLEV